MPVYLAKFPDGTVQIASAKNKNDLMHLLDEVGSPTIAQIKPLRGLEWIIEAEPVHAETEEMDDESFQVIFFKLRVPVCDAGSNLEELMSEAFPKLSEPGMGGLSFEEAKKLDNKAQLDHLGWKKGTRPEYDDGVPQALKDLFPELYPR